jgi:phage/plasmid-associated DNA primase
MKRDLISDICETLGDPDAILIHIPPGRKGPKIEGWQNFTVEQMRRPEYRAKLTGAGNIGVKLGHNALVTIDIDEDKFVETFLELNPRLRDTLRTKRKRGCNFWLRIEGDYPESCKLKTQSGEDYGEWRANGNQTVIHGAAIDRRKGEKTPTKYVIENRAQPIKLPFNEIMFPADVVRPWANKSEPIMEGEKELRDEYGDPYYTDAKGNLSALNESFWAGLFSIENVGLWEPDERRFYLYQPEIGIYKHISVDLIKHWISRRLLSASRQTNLYWLQTQRKDAKLDRIIGHLRGITERRDAFKNGEKRIHLANGVFSFDHGGELLAFSPALISRNRCPIVFDERATCERFLNELIYPAVHPDDVVLIQKYGGMCLLGLNLIQMVLILDGFSERGKTQLANVIQGIVGRENVTQLRTRFLDDRFEIYRYLTKTLLVGVDVAPNFLSKPGAAVIKGLVGGDWFDAEQKFGTACFPVQGNFCVVITSNSRLQVRLEGDVAAWRRRLLIVRYEGPAPKKCIPDFGELLVRTEGAGILNFFIAGLGMLLEDIDKYGKIVLTDRQHHIVDNLLAESDSLRVFLDRRVERAEGCNLSISEIVEKYAEFCPTQGWNPLPITVVHRSLEGLMLELFHVSKVHDVKREGRSVRGFSQVAFKQ